MKTSHIKTNFCALAGLSVLGLSHGASAQTPVALSLTSPISTASAGDTLTFTLNLTGGTNVGTYTTRVSVNSAYFSFIGTAPFTPTFGGFETRLQNSVNSGALNVSYGTFNANVNNVGTTALGTFQVKVLSALPIGGAFLTLSAPSGAASGNPSSVLNGDTGVNELTTVTSATILPTPAATPEPSQTAALGLGVLGLAGLALRARKTKQSA